MQLFDNKQRVTRRFTSLEDQLRREVDSERKRVSGYKRLLISLNVKI